MSSTRKIDIKNRPYYFFGEMTNIKNLDWNKIKIDKKSCKNIRFGYAIPNSVKPLYLMTKNANAYIGERKVNKSTSS